MQDKIGRLCFISEGQITQSQAVMVGQVVTVRNVSLLLSGNGQYVLAVLTVEIAVLWVVTLYSILLGYRSFGRICSLHIQGQQ
jgi:hypothetical protein